MCARDARSKLGPFGKLRAGRSPVETTEEDLADRVGCKCDGIYLPTGKLCILVMFHKLLSNTGDAIKMFLEKIFYCLW